MTSGPLNPMVLAHPSAVQRCREMMGPTKSYVAQIAAPHSIRGMYGLTDTRNSIHGSGESVLNPAAVSVYRDCCCEAQSISLRQSQVLHQAISVWGKSQCLHTRLDMNTLTCICPYSSTHPSTHTHTHTHTQDSEESVQREVPFFFPDFDSKRWLSLEEPAFRAGRVAFCQRKARHCGQGNGPTSQRLYC